MSTPPNQPNGNNGEDGIVPAGNGMAVPHDPIADAISALVEQTRESNAIQREIAQRGLTLAENAEQHQYDLTVKQIEATNVQHQRRYSLGRLMVILAGISVLFLLTLAGLVVAMAFFGNPTQSQTALTMLSYGFAAVGGGAVLLTAVFGVNAVFKWWQGI